MCSILYVGNSGGIGKSSARCEVRGRLVWGSYVCGGYYAGGRLKGIELPSMLVVVQAYVKVEDEIQE